MALESIGRILSRLAQEDPHRPAVTHEGRTISWRELDASTNRLARAYQQFGVKQDDLITVALPNGIEFYQACFATWKLGATPQPVSPRLPQPELAAIVDLANPTLIVGSAQEWFPERRHITAGFEPSSQLSDAPLPDRVAKYWKAPTSGGSTGRPKIIVSKVPGAFDRSELHSRKLPNRVHLVPGPLYHNGPFFHTMRGLLLGNHQVVLSRFDARLALEALESWRVDWVFFVPTMMHRIWKLGRAELDRFDLSALRIMLHLASPCPPWLKEAWIDWLGPERIHELYSGTEGLGLTWITGTEWLTHRGSVGKPQAGARIAILDQEGQPVQAGTVGEVYLCPPTGPGSTYFYIGAEPRRHGDWESLGDMGWLDDDGYLYLTDRKTDMILRGGANIYPAEVEAALDSHPLVRSSAVIGLPDEDLGQRVHAIVETIGSVTADELRIHVAGLLVDYKVPSSFELVTQPLRDDAGKVRRTALRDERLGLKNG
jgi:bile acid-coenzyme A ligase